VSYLLLVFEPPDLELARLNNIHVGRLLYLHYSLPASPAAPYWACMNAFSRLFHGCGTSKFGSHTAVST
jgi:hypothetical protein